ncbi:MAG: hypothetical protein ACE5LC_05355 [Candidatus Aminicenantales bacterium]
MNNPLKKNFLHRRFKFLLTLLLILAFFLSLKCMGSPGEKKFKPKFSIKSIKLTHGQGRIVVGDINRVLNSFNNNETFEWLREHRPELISGEIRPLDNRIYDLELELLMEANFLPPAFSLSLAASLFPFSTKNESSLTYIYRTWRGDEINKFTFNPELRVWTPFRTGVSYLLLSISLINIRVNGGIEFHSAKFSENSRLVVTYTSGNTEWGGFYLKASQLFFGLQGGIELELNLLRNFALVVEAEGSFAKLRNLKGELQCEHMNKGMYWEEKGSLWICNFWNNRFGARIHAFEISKGRPGGGIILKSDVRKAILDLSGYSFRIGARIRLF